ncbi:MAG: flagellar hook capping FlgD N-terminal domain-containing protein [Desulfobacteraceae bacterium]|jgi:flagellar basal-body rod modification protein FlgD
MSISTDYSNKDLFINGQKRDDTETVKKDSLGKEAFLTMMVAQLKNQDPLSPMEGTDFTAQLAQFSSLEQQITMNTNLSSILESLNAASANDNLFDYMGKNIVSDGNPVTLTKGEVVSGGVFELEEPASITVVVYDSTGTAVRRMSSGSERIEAGAYNIEWDGKNDDGYTVQDGEYTYEVKALNAKNQYTDVATETKGKVSGITSYYGKSYLMVDGQRVDPDSVESVAL